MRIFIFAIFIYIARSSIEVPGIKTKILESQLHVISLKNSSLCVISVREDIYIVYYENSKFIAKQIPYVSKTSDEIIKEIKKVVYSVKTSKKFKQLILNIYNTNVKFPVDGILEEIDNKFDCILFNFDNIGINHLSFTENTMGIYIKDDILQVQVHKFVNWDIHLYAFEFSKGKFANEMALDYFINDDRTKIKDREELDSLLNYGLIYNYILNDLPVNITSINDCLYTEKRKRVIKHETENRKLTISKNTYELTEGDKTITIEFSNDTDYRQYYPKFLYLLQGNTPEKLATVPFLYTIVKSNPDIYKSILSRLIYDGVDSRFEFFVGFGFVLGIYDASEAAEILQNIDDDAHIFTVFLVVNRFLKYEPKQDSAIDHLYKSIIAAYAAKMCAYGICDIFDSSIPLNTLRLNLPSVFAEDSMSCKTLKIAKVLNQVFSDFSIMEDFRSVFLTNFIETINSALFDNELCDVQSNIPFYSDNNLNGEKR